MLTAREIADRVRQSRKSTWDKADPTAAVVATQKLNPDDEQAVRRMVVAAGVAGEKQDDMIRQVTALLVGQVTALDDSQPADGAD